MLLYSISKSRPEIRAVWVISLGTLSLDGKEGEQTAKKQCTFVLQDLSADFFSCVRHLLLTLEIYVIYFQSLCSSAELPLGAESYLRERVLWMPSVCLWEECFCPPGILYWRNELQFGRTVYHCSEGQAYIKKTGSAAR